jgi:hypothetical protein
MDERKIFKTVQSLKLLNTEFALFKVIVVGMMYRIGVSSMGLGLVV